MLNKLVYIICEDMKDTLSKEQVKRLDEALRSRLDGLLAVECNDDVNMLEQFVAAKRVEGCSEKTLKYYHATLQTMLQAIEKRESHISTDDLRKYLEMYQKNNRISKVTLDNVRRILSSYFSWLEDEGRIIKNPVRRIHKVRTGSTVKETYSDEALEQMRDHCNNPRDLAIIDLLSSTGMRVGELVNLNKTDIDFENRECIVFGKGDKERQVYFDARTKIHLQKYIQSRQDNKDALFVSLQKPAQRLLISGVEIRLRKIGRELGLIKVHPHKFRRTLATTAIDRGMPIEQVQRLLGHTKIDTTMHYAMVNQQNVKNSCKRYLG